MSHNPFTCWALLILFLACPQLARAEAPATTEAPDLERQIQVFVRDLGDQDFNVRQRASESLLRIGLSALAALEQAANSDDPEIRIRARTILADVRLGIGPDWPDELSQLVRGFHGLNAQQRRAALQRVTNVLTEKAVPLLVLSMAGGDADEAEFSLTTLQGLKGEQVPKQVIRLVVEPKGPHQARALAWALSATGESLKGLKVLTRAGVEDRYRTPLIKAGVDNLLTQLKDRKFEQLARSAKELKEAAPDDARILYLEAEACIALDRDEEANVLRRQALDLNPAKESMHYPVAEMLQDMGRRRLAAQEWQKILAIPPADDVYDINAHMRLGSIYAASGRYARAADSLQTGIDLYTKARAGNSGMGLVGASDEELRAKIQNFLQKAKRFPQPADAPIKDAVDDEEIQIHAEINVKDGQLDALRKSLRGAAVSLSMNVEPLGFRLFDLPQAILSYDPAKQQIVVQLNGAPCAKPVPFQNKTDRPEISLAVQSLDCVYVYTLNTDTGESKQSARFEKDYRITIRPGRKIAGLRDVQVKLNDKPYEWQKLLEGATFDYLPEAFEIVFGGETPAGRPLHTKFKLTVKEPDLKSE